MKKKKALSIAPEIIENKILLMRGKKVMLDSDLAVLYRASTKAFNQAAKRNFSRFPQDFMFKLSKKEFAVLRSQIVTSKKSGARGGRQCLPLVFTEPGIAMLSSVLHSEQAMQANIQIMRVFIKLRELMFAHKDPQKKIEDMERKYDPRFHTVFEAIRPLLKNDEIINKRLTYEEEKEKNKKWGFAPNSERGK
ncbi:MAG: ORF6N domain-containing protein [Candidatus Margulisbacteria bacterium]|jgi:hypothetical protein|nr:ORF6N domain-containing protein [Candidatus Margulisiibacteriota bacterium]